jgi:predicted nucleotide-binding protein
MVKARAKRYIRDGIASDDVEVPVEFWWAEGEAALEGDWETGDFDTWIEHRIHLQAFGITFRRSDIESIKPAPVTSSPAPRSGRKIFIGHGRSSEWLKLKDFLKDELKLDVDEFNSVSVAGISTSARLKDMLDASRFAFLIMTAEDEQPDGTFNARMNVVHEAGLFQGKHGFEKAIVLLEEGCADFSNIHGLKYISFQKRNIKAAFEDVRGVLKREKLILR